MSVNRNGMHILDYASQPPRNDIWQLARHWLYNEVSEDDFGKHRQLRLHILITKDAGHRYLLYWNFDVEGFNEEDVFPVLEFRNHIILASLQLPFNVWLDEYVEYHL